MQRGMTYTESSSVAQLLAELTVLGKASVTVGFHADKKAKREGDDPATNAEIAASHEFGAGDQERRPFMGPAMEQGAGELLDLQTKVAGAVLDVQMTAEDACGIVGERAVAMIKAKIRSNVQPPLKQSTIDAKGSSVTLIDSAQMLNAVSYEVDLSGRPSDA